MSLATRSAILVVGVMLSAISVSSQMRINVRSDRVTFGSEFVPRPTAGPETLIVKRGESITISGDRTFDSIENAGTLTIAPNSTLRVTTLLNLPQATLEVQAPCGTRTEIVIRDVPLAPTDQHQWGNGLINFGTQRMIGCAKAQTWSVVAEDDLLAGATSVTIDNVEGWNTGDDLMFPDMRELSSGEPRYRRERAVSIASVNGKTITLSKPLDFEHSSVRTPDGAVVQRPYVANLTRNLVVRSENPAGTRGHTANVGHDASWDVQFVEFMDLGRTKTEPLDDQKNHAGRYSAHAHHAHGTGGRFIGNAFKNGAKWALVIHGTSDSLVQQNVAVDFPAGCFVTEDGNEYRNVFDRNFCAYSVGNQSPHQATTQVANNCPGCEGAGFWFRGIRNTIIGNVSINNVVGMNFFNQQFPVTGVTAAEAIPERVQGNATIANHRIGLEMWAAPLRNAGGELLFEDLVSAHNSENIFAGVSSPSSQIGLRNVRLIGQRGQSVGISSTFVYVSGLHIDGGVIAGHGRGIIDGGGRQLVVRNVTMQNGRNIDMLSPPDSALIENVVHVPFQDRPREFIVFGAPEVTNGELNHIRRLFEGYPKPPMDGVPRFRVVRHQGVEGDDFALFMKGQLRTGAVAPFVPDVCGSTLGETWERCGIAWYGNVLDPSQATTFDGLLHGYARRGLDPTPLGPPQAILLVPNRRVPPNSNSYASAMFLPTGDNTNTGEGIVVRYKGPTERDFGAPFVVSPSNTIPGFPTARAIPFQSGEGVHTYRTWRTQRDGKVIADSERTFTYCAPTACEDPPVSLSR